MSRERATFRISGMDCAEEVSLLRRELSRQRGIFDLTFDVLAGRMNVEFDPEMTSEVEIRQAVAQTGMRAEEWKATPVPRRDARSFSASLSFLALCAAVAQQSANPARFLLALFVHDERHGAPPPLVLACFLVAIVAGVWHSLPKAWHALRGSRADMNVLMVISISGAAWLGEWSEAATVAFLFSLANLLESWSLAKARRAIGSLLRVSPAEAEVRHGNHTHRVKVEQIAVGSTVVVGPGERIPCDGAILAGRTTVDQAILTGESVPVPKGPGDVVFAGTANGPGVLDVRTTRAHGDTTLSRILRMVEESQSRRAATEQWIERFARVYTPVTIVLAMVVSLLPPLLGFGTHSEWFYQGMVILLISCPCALVISTPVTILAALTSASRRGVLIKGGSFLEIAASIEAIAFDKTGVLTDGEFEVIAIHPSDGHSNADLLSRLAGLEERNDHPLARALVREARERGAAPAEARDVQAQPGRGAEGQISGENFWVGSPRVVAERNLSAPGAELLEHDAMTVVACGSTDAVHGLIALQDRVSPETVGALADLKRLGIRRLVMLTGDNPLVANRIAALTGIDEVHSCLLPTAKAAQIEAMRKQWPVTAMVGDGINDTPALAAAALGIALGAKSADAALETADVILMRNDLQLLPFLVSHSRRTMRVVKQNVGVALSLKLMFLMLAALGHATLWMAIVADMGATLLVIFNGLRLLRPR